MNSLLIATFLFGSALSQHWGHHPQVYETPEVVAAKAEHFAAHAKAHQVTQERSWNEHDSNWPADGSYKPEYEASSSWSDDDGSYKGEEASYKSDEGSWQPSSHAWAPQAQQHQWTTPQHAHPQPQAHHWEAQPKKWTGPIALPPGYDKNGAPLQVLDTPEVEAEKAKHFHLYAHGAHAAAAAAAAHGHAAPEAHQPSWNHHA